MTEMVMVLDCGYDDGLHEFPEDWIFGGANESDPRSDPRWMPTTYQYYDEKLKIIHVTQTPLCDEQAIDEFTKVTEFGSQYKPVYLAVKRRGESQFEMIPVQYDQATDTAKDLPS